MILARACLLIGVVFMVPAYAQTDAHALEDALKDKQLALRNFSAMPIAHYAWVDGKLVDKPAEVHTLGVYFVSSVKLLGKKLSIYGTRATVVRDTQNNKLGLAGKWDMEVQIDLNGSDPAVVLPQLRDLLFFPDLGAAITALPSQQARRVPAPLVATVSVDPCNCTKFIRGGEWVEVPKHDADFKRVSLVHSDDPSYTDAATKANVKGAVRFSLLVDAKGEPTDLWLLKPLGFGLDEAAEQSLKKYRFTPAIYNKQAVAVEMMVDISFDIR